MSGGGVLLDCIILRDVLIFCPFYVSGTAHNYLGSMLFIQYMSSIYI